MTLLASSQEMLCRLFSRSDQCRRSFRGFHEGEFTFYIRRSLSGKRGPLHTLSSLLITLLLIVQVASRFHLHLAAFKALHAEANGLMKSKTLATELLHSLSHERNIGINLKTFGSKPSDSTVLVCAFTNNEKEWGRLRDVLKGEEGSLDEGLNALNLDKLKSFFGLSSEEIDRVGIEKSVISRVATRESLQK